jgi:3-oxoacyl-[acyl-carrier protein] reductase
VKLIGKTAIVTGGSRGIGRAIVEALAEQGANVAFCGRQSDSLEKLRDELLERGVRCLSVQADVRNHREMEQFFNQVHDTFDSIDFLINNAGVAIYTPIDKMTPAEWSQVIDTNLSGVFNCCHAILPFLARERGSCIINIGSRGGKNAFAGGIAYNASKFGLIGLSEALFLDLRPLGIRVSYVMPGPVSTGLGGEPSLDWQLTPEDVAKAVIDILTHDSRAVASRVELRPAMQYYDKPAAV